MKIWAIVIGTVVAVLLWMASVAGAFYFGMDYKEAKVAEVKQAIEDTREKAIQGAASEIAKIKVVNTTIQGKVQTVVRDNPVYRDCQHDPAGLRLVNEALAGSAAKRDGGGSLPAADAAH